MLSILALIASGLFDCLHKRLLSGALDFGTVRVSRMRANWILISSNCARRLHSCARIASDLWSVGVGGAGSVW